MIRPLFEFMSCLVIMAIALKPASTRIRPEPSREKGSRAPGPDPGAPGSGPGLRGRELSDRVRESSRTLSGPSGKRGCRTLAGPSRQDKKTYCSLLAG